MKQGSVCYRDSTLYDEDVRGLQEGGWLTSNGMDFYLFFLEEERIRGRGGEGVAVVHPGAMYIISLTADPQELREDMEPLLLHTKHTVFFPLNNETQRDPSKPRQGSHWSLLVFSRKDKLFRHYDSCAGCNARLAKTLLPCLAALVDCHAAT